MSLYIAGNLSVLLLINDYRTFDKLNSQMSEMASLFDLFVERVGIKNGEAFAINSKNSDYQCIYSGGCFECDLSIADDPTFEQRVEKFLKALNEDERFKAFHNKEFTKPAKRYYVIS